MRPAPRIEVKIVEKRYWACKHPEHRHTSYEIAEACLSRQTAGVRWTEALMQEAYAAKSVGATLKAVGALYDVSAGRMREILIRYEQLVADRWEDAVEFDEQEMLKRHDWTHLARK